MASSSDDDEWPEYTPFDATMVKHAKKSCVGPAIGLQLRVTLFDRWKKVKALLPNWHELFFEILFERAPGGKALFPFDLTTIVGNRDIAVWT
jgi:hypothetical protein